MSTPQTNVYLNTHYNPFIVLFNISVLIYLLFRIYDNAKNTNLQTKPLQIIIQTMVLLFLLIIISGIFSYIATSLGYIVSKIQVSPPQKISSWLWFIFGTTVFACFEEILFRLYLPEQAKKAVFYVLSNKLSSKDATKSMRIVRCGVFFCEALVIVLFALAHRYMGFFAVCTAFSSAILLRLSVLKSGSIIPACVAHILNNLIAFLVIFYA